MGCCCCRPVPKEEPPVIDSKDPVLNHDNSVTPVILGKTDNHDGITKSPENKTTGKVDALSQPSNSSISNDKFKSDTLGTNKDEEIGSQYSKSSNSTVVNEKIQYDSASNGNGFKTESNSEKSGTVHAANQITVTSPDVEPPVASPDGKLASTTTAETTNFSSANMGKSVLNVNNEFEENIDYSESQTESGELNSNLYEQWVRSIRMSLKEYCSPKDVRSNYEFSQVVRRVKNLTTQDALIMYVLSHTASFSLISSSGNELVNKYVALFIEQFDLNRNDTISTKELWDFLFPPEGVRELGLLIKIVREGLIKELNIKKTVVTADTSEFYLYEAIVPLAKRLGVYINPYIGLNLETKFFRAIIEALNIIQKKEEVDAIINAIDVNVDRRLSSEEVKKFLFPPPHPDYLAAYRGQSGTQATSKSRTTTVPIKVDSQNINSVADEFRKSLLAKCDNKKTPKEQVEQMFNAVDKDGDSHLTMLEMKEVLVNFFMSLREVFIEEVSDAILETIQENLPHNKTGLIPLSDFRNFLLEKDSSFSGVAQEARLSLKLTSLGSDSLALLEEIIKAADTDKDGFVSPPEVLQCLQYLMGETQRREVEEDASGINGLLFEFIDLNKNGTIELSELLEFLWPNASTASGASESPSPRSTTVEGSAKAVREKILEKLGLVTTAADVTIIHAAVDGVSDDILRARFLSFLESFPTNKGYKCMTNDLFVSLALERALTCLPMPKFGITQQLNREEVAHMLKQMDINSDGVVSVDELRAWLKA